MPNNYRFTEITIIGVLNNLKHSAVLTTVTEILQNYWKPGIGQQVKKNLRKCVINYREVIAQLGHSTVLVILFDTEKTSTTEKVPRKCVTFREVFRRP